MKPFLLVSTRPEEEALDSEYQAYLRASGLEREDLELAEFDLLGLPPIDPHRYSGIFVAGSPYGASARDGYVSPTQQAIRDELLALLTQLMEAGTPLMATGAAMNILTGIVGGTVSVDFAEYGELVEVELVAAAEDDPVFAGLPPIFLAYANHGEAVDGLPEPAVKLARSLDVPIQAFRFGDRVYGIQFNPELDAEAIKGRSEAFEDAGDTGFGDVEALVATGRNSEGAHSAAGVIAGFVDAFRA